MLKMIHVASRILLGLIYFIFGGMGLMIALGVMTPEMPPMPEKAQLYMQGIMASGYFFPLLKATEVICGLLLLVNLASPLALVILAPITLNIFLHHLFLTPGLGNLILPAAMAALHIVAMVGYLKQYRPLFSKD